MKMTSSILCTALLLSGATALAGYRVDGHIGKGKIGSVSQIAIGAGDTLCALEKNGKVTIFDPDGSLASTIDTGMKNTDAMAVDSDGNLHIFSTLTEEKKVKSGARMRTVQIPIGVECGIFDFCEAPDNTIAVSNLGAFKLQQFDLDGKLLKEFGQRGRGLDDFQGCCNPVSAGYLPGGGILTVEKSPTRIKIYDANGKNAQLIDGIEELVKGCSFIPVAVDSKGNIYLAASAKGYIVKCVP